MSEPWEMSPTELKRLRGMEYVALVKGHPITMEQYEHLACGGEVVPGPGLPIRGCPGLVVYGPRQWYTLRLECQHAYLHA